LARLLIRPVYGVRQRNVTTLALSISYGIAVLLSAYGLPAIREQSSTS
jgi:hypothetical protein